MEENQSQRELAEQWLGFTLQNWKKQLGKLRIGDSKVLLNSFEGNVVEAANGDILKIKIAYAWYGKMVDMGVGRGTKLGDVKENNTSRRLLGKVRGNRRRPKRWYGKGRDSIGHQVARLSKLLGIDMATHGVEKISGSVNEHVVFEL